MYQPNADADLMASQNWNAAVGSVPSPLLSPRIGEIAAGYARWKVTTDDLLVFTLGCSNTHSVIGSGSRSDIDAKVSAPGADGGRAVDRTG